MNDRGWFAIGGHSRSPTSTRECAAHNKQGDELLSPTESAAHKSLQRSQSRASSQPTHHKPPKLSRISSYIGLGAAAKSQQSPTSPLYPEKIMDRSQSLKSSTIVSYHGNLPSSELSRGVWRPTTVEDEYSYREADCTWHNPNLRQMMETVSCAIMRNGASAPIPRHLNGFISSMIEEFSHHFSELKTLRKDFQQLQETREKELKDFATMADEWKDRETAFKAEINRLEHIIAKSQKGAESVLLARAGSVVNRNDGRAFRAKLNRFSKSTEDEYDNVYLLAVLPNENGLPLVTSAYKTLGTMPRILDHNSDVCLSEQLRGASSTRRSNRYLKEKAAAGQAFVQVTGGLAPHGGEVAIEATSQRHSDTSPPSSSENVSSGSSASLVTKGLLAEGMAQLRVTLHPSPKQENLGGQSDKKPTGGQNPFEAIRELARQNGGLPEDVINDEDSSYASSIAFPPNRRPFSFVAGDKIGASSKLPLATAPLKNVGPQLEQSSQLSAAQDPATTSKFAQFDGSDHASNDISCVGSDRSRKSCSSAGTHSSGSGILFAMGRNLITKVDNDEVTAAEDPNSACEESQASSADPNRLTTPSPTKRVQDGEVPRRPQLASDNTSPHRMINLSNKSRGFISDEELAQTIDTPQCVTNLQTAQSQIVMPPPTQFPAVKRLSSGVERKPEAALPACRALKRSAPVTKWKTQRKPHRKPQRKAQKQSLAQAKAESS